MLFSHQKLNSFVIKVGWQDIDGSVKAFKAISMPLVWLILWLLSRKILSVRYTLDFQNDKRDKKTPCQGNTNVHQPLPSIVLSPLYIVEIIDVIVTVGVTSSKTE